MKKSFLLTLLCSHLPLASSLAETQDIPYGIEAVTGFRSGYIHRGFKLAETVLDLQLETEISLSNHTFLNLGGWYLAEGNGDFWENGGFVDLRHTIDQLTLGASLTYRHVDHSVIESGLDLGAFVTWSLNDDWDWKTGAYYDFGAEGLYLSSDVNWTKVVTDSSFISILLGLSFVDDYYGRNGLNDLYARLTYTYAISDRIAVSPFLGGSLVLDDEGYRPEDEIYGGFSFEVNF